jgi:NDP-sugar pyrophosphorylase family protein
MGPSEQRDTGIIPRSTVHKPTILVLAAGMASRYGDLKQVAPVGPNGETIIDYSIYDALRAGFGKIVIVIRSATETQFRETIGARLEERIPVEYVFQELDKLPSGFAVPPGRAKPWGTAHAVLMAADAIREPFATITADDFYGAESYRRIAQHLTSGATNYGMVGYILRNTLSDFGSVARAICRVSGDNFLESVVELTRIERVGAGAINTGADGEVTNLTGDEVVSMNMWGFTPAVFPQLAARFQEFLEKNGRELASEFYIPQTVNDLIAAGDARVKVLPTNESWFGVTYSEDRSRVVDSLRELIARGEYPDKLWT